jgi:surface polysaccharide O-acyltransferase-like enzyme
MEQQQTKIASIEAVRAIAIFCIIATHTAPFLRTAASYDGWYYLGHIVQQFNSFAVPFFFITSGYFFSLGIDKQGVQKQLKKQIPRLSLLLLIWIVLNGLFWGQWIQEIVESGSLWPMLANLLSVPAYAMQRPDVFWFWGTAVPLWFLVSLIEGCLLLSLLITLRLSKNSILIIGTTAYLFMLSSGVYSDTLLGVGFRITFPQRGIFIALFFISIGHFLAHSTTNINGLKLLLGSVVLMFIESALISAHNNQLFSEHPYLLSTPFFAIAAFLFATQNPTFGENSLLFKMGTISLGIYVVHPPVIGALDYLADSINHPPIWELAYPFITLLISTIIVLALQKIPYLRKAVS